MKVNGTATLNASADRVWAALNDPAVLVRTIPGCEQLEAVGPDSYRMTITAGVAPRARSAPTSGSPWTTAVTAPPCSATPRTPWSAGRSAASASGY